MKIPRWADTAGDWISCHRWLTASLTVAIAAGCLLFWVPAVAAFVLGVFAGACVTRGAGRDKRLLLDSRHDADQLLIGRLRGDIARLQAIPAADAATHAIRYITDSDLGRDGL